MRPIARRGPLLAALGPALLACAAIVGAGRGLSEQAAWDAAWTAAAAALVSMVAGRAAATATDRSRWTWWSAATGCWLLGQIAWDLQPILGVSSSPSVADAAWWAFAVLMVIALLRVRAGASRTERLVAAAEVLALIGATMALTFSELWTVASASTESAAPRLSALAYPVVYVSAAVVTLHAMLGGALRRIRGVGPRLVLTGIVVQALAFILWAPQLLKGTYLVGTTVIARCGRSACSPSAPGG